MAIPTLQSYLPTRQTALPTAQSFLPTVQAAQSTNAVVNSTISPLLNQVGNVQSTQSSTIVSLSTQGQTLSLADQPNAPAEQIESAAKESGESPMVQFQENEGGAQKAQPRAGSMQTDPALAAQAQQGSKVSVYA